MKPTPDIEDFEYYKSNLEEAVGLYIDQDGTLVEVIGDSSLKIEAVFAEFINLAEVPEIIIDYCLTPKK